MKEQNDKRRIEEFREFLMETEKSTETINSYMEAVRQYYEMFDELTKVNLLEYKQWMLENRKPGTAGLRCVGMNCYLSFMGMDNLKVKGVRIYSRTSLENVITDEEYEHFLSCLKEEGQIKLYFMVRFMAGTGCRVSELVKMERNCLKSGEFTMWTKGKVRRILIPKSLIEESREYFASFDSKYLFPNRYGKRMGTRGVSSQLVKYGERYGIRREVLHAHTFRHYFATRFLEANGNLSLLQNLLGHESISTTSVYLQLSKEKQKDELDKAVDW